jgi:hypothetical protein
LVACEAVRLTSFPQREVNYFVHFFGRSNGYKGLNSRASWQETVAGCFFNGESSRAEKSAENPVNQEAKHYFLLYGI